MISSLIDIMVLIDKCVAYLEGRGCRFDGDGFPILKRECFIDSWPNQLVPYRNRKSRIVEDPLKTALCFYCEDKRIYPRFEKLLDDIPEYRRFLGVVATDVTVTVDMDIEWQREIMLLNQLFMAIVAVNGVKVALNLRCGSHETLSCFDSVPPGVMCASGTLGCAPTVSSLDMSYLEKILRVRPSGVLLYGKKDSVMEDQLNVAGVPYRRYDDVHRIMQKESNRK